jgi:hypothetical protein
MMYPNRMLTCDDFVVCELVAKIHDLSLFRQMNVPMVFMEGIGEGFWREGDREK